MPYLLLENSPTELAEHADPGLRRQEFAKRLRTYLEDQNFPEDKNLAKLVPTLFRITRYYLRTKKVMPRMLKKVNSRDWLTREKQLAQKVHPESTSEGDDDESCRFMDITRTQEPEQNASFGI